jgi:glucosyl-3-phosphoglycerate synthase
MRRSYDHRDYPPLRVLGAKRGRLVSVCLPARNEAATVGQAVRLIRSELMERDPIVDELIVIDDGSTDATAAVAAEAGARVVAAAGVLPDYGIEHGKGQAMWKGLHVSSGDVVVFCDADIREFHAGFVLGLIGPLLSRDDVAFVKAFYERPLDGRPGEGGRVTELMARPLISVFFPHLNDLYQPLSGEFAAPREVLEAVSFVGGYGVDLGLLVDVTARFGNASLVQSDLGERVHRNRPLAELGPQALAVLQVALQRAGVGAAAMAGTVPDHHWTTELSRPGEEPATVTLVERPPLVEVPGHLKTA